MRKVFVGACVVSMVSLSMAQHLEVAVDGGYGLGVGTAFSGSDSLVDPNYSFTEYEAIYASGGGGLKMMGEVTYFFNENIGVMVASGYSMLGGYSMEKIEPLDTIRNTITSSGYLPVNVGVKFKAKMGNIVPYLYLAPGIYLPGKAVKDSTHVTDIARDKTKITSSYAMGWGVSAGIGAMIMVSEKVGIKLEVTPTFAFATQSQYVREYLGAKHTYIYKDDMVKLPPNTSSDTTYVHGAPRDSYSSVAVKAGVCFRVF
jgi:outer membrane protein W